ncbi:MAG: C-GCAxxG-C-C family protein [Spirochaetota bacterium]
MRYYDLISDDYMLRNDYNCAETMLVGANEAYAIGLDTKALHAASAFGGGMGRERACGALTGALMALGCMRSSDWAHKDARLGELRDDFVRRFESTFGSLDCAVIKQTHRSETRGCQAVVEIAASLVEEVLEGDAALGS